MNTASADSRKSWSVNLEYRPAALEITLLKLTYVLPWSQLLYAEGGNDEVRAVFATHEVIIRGSGLDELLADMAMQAGRVYARTLKAGSFLQRQCALHPRNLGPKERGESGLRKSNLRGGVLLP